MPDEKHHQGFGRENDYVQAKAGNFFDCLFVVDGQCELAMYCDRDCRALTNTQPFGSKFREELHLRQVRYGDFFEYLRRESLLQTLQLFVLMCCDFSADVVCDNEAMSRYTCQ